MSGELWGSADGGMLGNALSMSSERQDRSLKHMERYVRKELEGPNVLCPKHRAKPKVAVFLTSSANRLAIAALSSDRPPFFFNRLTVDTRQRLP